MTHLRTPAESPLFAPAEAALGYVPNYTKVSPLPTWSPPIPGRLPRRRFFSGVLSASPGAA